MRTAGLQTVRPLPTRRKQADSPPLSTTDHVLAVVQPAAGHQAGEQRPIEAANTPMTSSGVAACSRLAGFRRAAF